MCVSYESTICAADRGARHFVFVTQFFNQYFVILELGHECLFKVKVLKNDAHH